MGVFVYDCAGSVCVRNASFKDTVGRSQHQRIISNLVGSCLIYGLTALETKEPAASVDGFQ